MNMNENVFFFLKFKNDVRFFYDNLSVADALRLMKAHGYTAVPVTDNQGRYKGSVSEGDFLWFILEHGSDPEVLSETLVGELIRPDFMPAELTTISFEELQAASLHQNYVPIIDDRGCFIGIVTRQSIIHWLMKTGKAEKGISPIHASAADRLPVLPHAEW